MLVLLFMLWLVLLFLGLFSLSAAFTVTVVMKHIYMSTAMITIFRPNYNCNHNLWYHHCCCYCYY